MSTELLDRARQLSIEERIELVAAIWNSVAEDAGVDDLPLSEAHRAELDRRIEKYRANPDEGSTWEEVRSRLESDR